MIIRFLQQQVKPQTLLLLMGSIILLTLLAAYLYLFKQPLVEYRNALQTLDSLKNAVNPGISPSSQIESTRLNVLQLEKKLLGPDPQLPINQKFAAMIGKLDAISSHHSVQLHSVTPGEVMKVFIFQELPINIEITGSYFSLFDWLQQVENELKTVTVKQFEISPNIETSGRSMKLQLASYQLAQSDKP